MELLRRGLATGRDAAARLIEEGAVTVDGVMVSKPARLVATSSAIEFLRPVSRYVSRGGEKLEGALREFGIDPTALDVLDVGSSTGGFTDCLLQHGAKSVTAVDVGTHQLHERLREDARVRLFEQTDIRRTSFEELGASPFKLAVCDLSFVSLGDVMAPILGFLEPEHGELLALVKPQFEATKRQASQAGGVIRDPEVWLQSLVNAQKTAQASGATTIRVMESPIRGGKGNVEFLVHLTLKQGQVGIDVTQFTQLIAKLTADNESGTEVEATS